MEMVTLGSGTADMASIDCRSFAVEKLESICPVNDNHYRPCMASLDDHARSVLGSVTLSLPVTASPRPRKSPLASGDS